MNPNASTPTAEQLAARDAAAARAFLAPDETSIGTITLRATTAGSLGLLRLTKNEFLDPRGPLQKAPILDSTGIPRRDADEAILETEQPTIENEFFAALEFAYIHSAPLAEVRRVVWTPAIFREKVLELGDTITPAQIPALTEAIRLSLSTIEALKFATEAKPSPDSKEPPAPPN